MRVDQSLPEIVGEDLHVGSSILCESQAFSTRKRISDAGYDGIGAVSLRDLGDVGLQGKRLCGNNLRSLGASCSRQHRQIKREETVGDMQAAEDDLRRVCWV